VIGETLGHYRVTGKLGSGGMGDVYRARDLNLGRDVAVKVLREDLASDPERLRRFEQEARSASALNHPSIVTIHDVGMHGSTPYMAMEYVEGRTLRDVLLDGPLPTRRLLHLAIQIAEGLAKAHAAGIVHRDLKPENLMVTTDGFAKILDFGLAKLRMPPPTADSETATMARTSTAEGTLVGTVAYMSPEQARGESTDFRSDQFAFGTVLYEMMTGRVAFRRDSSIQTLSAIIEQDPEPMSALAASSPAHLRLIVETCLAKNPGERYDSTRDLARELQRARDALVHADRAAQPAAKPTPDGNQPHVPRSAPADQMVCPGSALAKRIACSQLSMKNDISHIVFDYSEAVADAIGGVSRKIRCDTDEVFFVNQGCGEITIVCENDKKKMFGPILAQAAEIQDRTAVVRIRDLRVEGVTPGMDVPGLYAFFIGQLAMNGVNILELISTRTQLTLLVDEEDLSLAFSVLNEAIRDFRGREGA
jgi:serine/threonine protein kinase